MKILFKILIPVYLFAGNIFFSEAQNVAITDDESYKPEPSAQLDVYSLNKGFLVPRLTTEQRLKIEKPSHGLMVYDTDLKCYYFYNGSIWTNFSLETPSELWTQKGFNIFPTDARMNLGVGTDKPVGKLMVKGDAEASLDAPLFSVVNPKGDTVFAVYPEGVRVNVADYPGKASGNKGGFAVGGFSPSKGALTNEYLRITPDSIRVYVEETAGKANKGGFAVGGFTPGKGITDKYLNIRTESSSVFVDGEQGFSVSNIVGANKEQYLKLKPDNYFIGHQSGLNTTGIYNIFLGYQTGFTNTLGHDNTFIGYQTGYKNTSGSNNTFLGYLCGFNNNTGGYNVFVGASSGINNTSGTYNTFIGLSAGYANTIYSFNTYLGCNAGVEWNVGQGNTFLGTNTGFRLSNGGNNTFVGTDAGRGGNVSSSNVTANNTLIGCSAGYLFKNGSNNTYLGFNSGYNNAAGSGNVFLGNSAGSSETAASNKLFIANSGTSTPLIYGTFPNTLLRFNATTVEASNNLSVTNNITTGGNVIADDTIKGSSIDINGVSMGKLFISGNGNINIISTANGAFILNWDKNENWIEIVNNNTSIPCNFWFQKQSKTTTSGDANIVDPSSGAKIITGINNENNGFEIHFGQADGTAGWCSVWLQYFNGSLVGHYIKY